MYSSQSSHHKRNSSLIQIDSSQNCQLLPNLTTINLHPHTTSTFTTVQGHHLAMCQSSGTSKVTWTKLSMIFLRRSQQRILLLEESSKSMKKLCKYLVRTCGHQGKLQALWRKVPEQMPSNLKKKQGDSTLQTISCTNQGKESHKWAYKTKMFN